VHRPKCHGGAA
jgi:hypothetical protein